MFSIQEIASDSRITILKSNYKLNKSFVCYTKNCQWKLPTISQQH